MPEANGGTLSDLETVIAVIERQELEKYGKDEGVEAGIHHISLRRASELSYRPSLASPDEARHLKECGRCDFRIRAFVDNPLFHPSPEDVAAADRQLLPEEDCMAIMTHVNLGCPHCNSVRKATAKS